MELTHQLAPMLRTLRLSGILETLDVRNRQAVEQQSSFVEFLTLLLQDEVERRAQSKLRLRLRRAAFDPTKTLEGFDFSFNPKLNKAQVFDLATCLFIERHENVLIYGPTGVGKSHVGQALAHEACRRGYEVLFVATDKMLGHLAGGRADGTRESRLARYTRPDLLVLDDFGLKPLRAPGPEDLYDVINERYERGSILVTSNRDRAEWPDLFGEPLLASAALDRLTHGAHFVEITGQSFRAEHTKKQLTARRSRGATAAEEGRRLSSCSGSGHAATLAPYARPRVALDRRPLTTLRPLATSTPQRQKLLDRARCARSIRSVT